MLEYAKFRGLFRSTGFEPVFGIELWFRRIVVGFGFVDVGMLEYAKVPQTSQAFPYETQRDPNKTLGLTKIRVRFPYGLPYVFHRGNGQKTNRVC